MSCSNNNETESTSSDSSAECETASEGSTSFNKMEGEDVFETSDYLAENDETVKSNITTSSSVASSRDGVETAWLKYPKGARSIARHSSGILYMDRFQSFINNKWPYDVKRGNLCHPRALALAGLAFHSCLPAPSAQCVVCRRIFDNLETNSNPWILHSELSPNCLIVRLGQRDKVDDYSMDQILEMTFVRMCNDAEIAMKNNEQQLKKRLYLLKKKETMLLGAQAGSHQT